MLSGYQALGRNIGRDILFAQGPIMEDDDDNDSGSVVDYDGSEVAGSISDSDQVEEDVLIGSHMMSNGMLVPSNQFEQPSYMTMKPGAGNQVQCVGLGDIVYGQNTMGHLMLQEDIDDEMLIQENVEDESTPDGVILIPNSMLKQEIIESEEVIVDSNLNQNVGNEIIISDQMNGGVRQGPHQICLSDMDYDGAFDSNLIIDTGLIKEEGVGPSVGYNCGECGAILKSRGALKKHIVKYHSPSEPEMADVANMIYNCVSCAYQTRKRHKLDKHMAKHIFEGLNPSGKKRNATTPLQRMRHAAEEYKCAQCPYRCTVGKALKKHVKQHQAGTMPITMKVSCKICGKDRSSTSALRKHMKKHVDGRGFLCDLCGFVSIQLKKIIQHRRLHTGEKPHLCPHCSYRSARRDNLRSHVRRMHKKENMYIDTFNPTVEYADTLNPTDNVDVE